MHENYPKISKGIYVKIIIQAIYYYHFYYLDQNSEFLLF